MVALVAVVIVGLVATMAVGLLTSTETPGNAVKPPDAPGVEMLGTPPQGIEYTDLGEQCDQAECFRPIAVTAEGRDADEAIEAVYTQLLDRGWGRLLPQGESDPETVPLADSALSDGGLLVQASRQPYTPESTAGLILAHSVPPSPPAS
ncbi:hypothetical protein [Nocardiopsis ansamitocini]|uniref:Uncharacterized protein n=1 Tax=Nocardiopsis ansamitocini TaxID=1670832 RepID=A0A9W6UIQ4_9ACTN|nr:hypothetical protein [Nocardiopsis ansamitocini]GLU47285.1 hypothetical protein Nans01_16360 [Nocardiopsis ansamitocini]